MLELVETSIVTDTTPRSEYHFLQNDKQYDLGTPKQKGCRRDGMRKHRVRSGLPELKAVPPSTSSLK